MAAGCLSWICLAGFHTLSQSLIFPILRPTIFTQPLFIIQPIWLGRSLFRIPQSCLMPEWRVLLYQTTQKHFWHKIKIVKTHPHLASGPWKKCLNFIFPTKYVIPKSLKFSHWPSKHQAPRHRCFTNINKSIHPPLKRQPTKLRMGSEILYSYRPAARYMVVMHESAHVQVNWIFLLGGWAPRMK